MASYKYICTRCGSQATKEPVKPLKDWRTASPNEFTGLGHWRCPRCGKTKVKRT